MGRKRIHPESFECETCKTVIINVNGFPLVRFCSNSCAGKWKFKNSNNFNNVAGWNRGMKISGMSGKKQSDLFLKLLRQRNILDNPSKREDVKEKMSLAKIGKYGPLTSRWKGGITSKKNLWRCRKDYKKWRAAVLARDGYTCLWCGGKESLQTDHIRPVYTHPLEKYQLNNGRTLCVTCHRKTDTYGARVFAHVP